MKTKKSLKTVKVYCGETVEKKCGLGFHPVNQLKMAKKMLLSKKDEVAYSNNSDFISAIKYIGEKHNVSTEFFLNGISVGNDIEPIFADLNRAIDMLYDLAIKSYNEKLNLKF